MSKKWVYRFSELDQIEEYVGGSWDNVRGLLGGKGTNPDIKVGISGEHGGEAKSIALCHKLGLNYVSCSPFRVPLARLAAARAEIVARK